MRYLFTGTANIKATPNATAKLAQNNAVAGPAITAPGIKNKIIVSTISMVAIEKVSDAKARRADRLKPMPCLSNGRMVNEYPKRNARPIASAIVACMLQPKLEPMTLPRISPIAHPVKQCNVACMAVLVKSSILSV